MGVFTFVFRKSGDAWTAKQHSGEIEASAASTFELQRKLVQAVLAIDSSDGGGIHSSYSPVSPSSAVFQVIVTGPIHVIGGADVVAPATEKKEEEKVEEEEEEDDDFVLSLFD